MTTQIEAMKRWVEVFDGNWHDEPVDTEWADRAHQALAEMRQAIAEAQQPSQPLTDIYRSFEQWKNGNVLEHGMPRTEYYSEAQLDLVEMGWKYGYDAGLAEQPAQQEPVAEVKAKTTGGNVGIATVIHEIYSPLREPLQPGDKLYAAHRWMGWDVEQVWSERIFGIDMRFENVQDAIAFRKKLDEAAHGITKGNT